MVGRSDIFLEYRVVAGNQSIKWGGENIKKIDLDFKAIYLIK